MHLPPLYPILDAGLDLPLSAQARRLGEAGYPLVQFRGKPLDARTQWSELAAALRESAHHGGWPAICVNDRADLAVLASLEGLTPWGLHLGQEDLPPGETRGIPGLEGLHLGTSTHEPAQWEAPDPACDHAGVGPVRATATKPGAGAPLGLEGLAQGCAALRARGVAPVAIGGLGPEDARDCFLAGAEALAMVGAVARSGDPRELLWQVQLERWRVRPPVARGRGVVLIGGSGAGKSSLARTLARRMGQPVLDVDRRVAATAGKTIPDLFQEVGEAGFRALEAAALGTCLHGAAVVALGAGGWEDPASRAAVVQAGYTPLWVAEVPELAWARVGGDPGRPLAAGRERFMSRWASRTAAWSEAAMVLPLGRSAEALADAILG